jgi:regulatory protein
MITLLSYKDALARATELCIRSEKCSFDIALKCRDWQLSREESDQLIACLVQEKFIDHLRYAISFVHDKFRFNKWGKIKLAYALRQKKVEEKYISEALSHVPEDAYLKVLADLLSAKAKSVKDKDSYTRRNKLLTFAQSHGFESEEILKVIEQFKFLHL